MLAYVIHLYHMPLVITIIVLLKLCIFKSVYDMYINI